MTSDATLPPRLGGAHVRARTGDLVLTKDVLCQLSYVGARRFCRNPAMIGNHVPILVNLGIGYSERRWWWAGRESNPHSRRRLIYSQRSSPPAQPTQRLRSAGGALPTEREYSERLIGASTSYGLRLAIGSVTLPVEEPAHDRGLAAQLDDRLKEVGDAAQVGDGRSAGVAISEYLRTLSELTRNGVTDRAILALLQRHQDTLQQLLSMAPAEAADGVRKALDAASSVGVGAPHSTPPQAAGSSAPPAGKP
jgi:hypothetical protein